MKKILAGFVVIVFAGLLCTSLVSVFGGEHTTNQYTSILDHHPYYMTY